MEDLVKRCRSQSTTVTNSLNSLYSALHITLSYRHTDKCRSQLITVKTDFTSLYFMSRHTSLYLIGTLIDVVPNRKPSIFSKSWVVNSHSVHNCDFAIYPLSLINSDICLQPRKRRRLHYKAWFYGLIWGCDLRNIPQIDPIIILMKLPSNPDTQSLSIRQFMILYPKESSMNQMTQNSEKNRIDQKIAKISQNRDGGVSNRPSKSIPFEAK